LPINVEWARVEMETYGFEEDMVDGTKLIQRQAYRRFLYFKKDIEDEASISCKGKGTR
jgi:hypothetical protein